MAKRFTDSDKWKDRFFRQLKTEYKLLWLYMWDDCNHAGIWSVDFEVGKVRLGVDIDEKEALKQFGIEVQVIDNGDKWFMPGFIEFQYGKTLDPDVKAQKSVLKILHEHNVDCEDYLYGKELPF